MKTPKEKANELIERFVNVDINLSDFTMYHAKKCALICVDEIELYRKQIEKEYNEDLYHAYGTEEYLQEVKQEIEKL